MTPAGGIRRYRRGGHGRRTSVEYVSGRNGDDVTHSRANPLVSLCAATLLALLVGGCAPAGEGDELDGELERVSISHRMTMEPEAWRTGPVTGGGRLEFVPTGYRMTAGGWPLVSPSQDPAAVDLDPVIVEARLSKVHGSGLYGVACGVTASSAYVFVVGEQADGEPYYGIALLEDGSARVLGDSNAQGRAPAEEVLPERLRGTAVTVQARCSSGGSSGPARLRLAVGGEQLLDIEAPDGEPTGQVGLVALSRIADDLVVDVDRVSVRSPS